MASTRRQLLASAAAVASSLVQAGDPAARPLAASATGEAPGIGVIGLRYQGSVIAAQARPHGRIVAIADADRDCLDLKIIDNNVKGQTIDAIVNHMGNFFDCVAARRQPIADVEAGHRSVAVCHLGNISCRLGRKLSWDPTAERFVSDAEADAMLARPQRPGFEVCA